MPDDYFSSTGSEASHEVYKRTLNPWINQLWYQRRLRKIHARSGVLWRLLCTSILCFQRRLIIRDLLITGPYISYHHVITGPEMLTSSLLPCQIGWPDSCYSYFTHQVTYRVQRMNLCSYNPSHITSSPCTQSWPPPLLHMPLNLRPIFHRTFRRP